MVVYKKALIFFSRRMEKCENRTHDLIVIFTVLQRCLKAQLSHCILPRSEFWEKSWTLKDEIGIHVTLTNGFSSSYEQRIFRGCLLPTIKSLCNTLQN